MKDLFGKRGIKIETNALKISGKKEYNIKFIESSRFKYGIYKPRELEHPIRNSCWQPEHSFPYRIFKLLRFINPIFKTERLIN